MFTKNKYNIDKITGYLNLLSEKDIGGFKYHEKNISTVLSTSFGVQINYLLKNLTAIPVENIAKYLTNQQNEKNGIFIDAQFNLSDIRDFDEEYILWQFTYFSTIALDMMNKKPKYPFYFLDELKNQEKLNEWLGRQFETDFWYSSNKIMFLLYFLTFEQINDNIDNSDLIAKIFQMLDSKQDTKTGYWHTKSNIPLEHAMYGAAHIYFYYDYFNHQINYKERIVDTTLNLQNNKGLFGTEHGGACEDYNAIEILSILSKKTDYGQDRITKAFYKMHSIISKNQNSDGGFSYWIDNRNNYRRIIDSIRKPDNTYTYSGWSKMRNNKFASDLWGTYFRILTLAKIEKYLKFENYDDFQFYGLPGWGYF